MCMPAACKRVNGMFSGAKLFSQADRPARSEPALIDRVQRPKNPVRPRQIDLNDMLLPCRQ